MILAIENLKADMSLTIFLRLFLMPLSRESVLSLGALEPLMWKCIRGVWVLTLKRFCLCRMTITRSSRLRLAICWRNLWRLARRSNICIAKSLSRNLKVNKICPPEFANCRWKLNVAEWERSWAWNSWRRKVLCCREVYVWKYPKCIKSCWHVVILVVY